jgi:cytochrome c-type biogenesis protein CcmH
MIEHLAERLKGNPADVAGWSMLARTYSVVGRISDAVDAYAKAVALSKDDAGLLVDYADALGVKNNHSLAGEPIALIDRALKIAPKNVKALALAGTYAFDRQDYSAAVKYWDKVLEIGGADNMFAQRIQVQLENARQLTAPATDAKTAASSATVGAAVQSTKTANKSGAGSVGGVVTLLPSLLGTVKPDDAVFIFARLSQGSRMPLAILRKQVKDLPVAFTLNLDAASMPTLASNEKPVIEVLARISKSGNAVASKGDLSGQSAVVKVGAKDVSIEINQTINQ